MSFNPLAPAHRIIRVLKRERDLPDKALARDVLDEVAPPKKKPPRIRCPKCGWEPGKESRWTCREGCRHVWNTFDTHGVCPACRYRWTDTACLACHQWSRHDDWYSPEDKE